MQSPGHREHPEHHVIESPVQGRLRAQLGADVLAESDDVIEVDEDGNPPRYYFPRDSVRMDRMSASDTHTYCPFKGEASYFTMEFLDGQMPDAAWTLKDPYDEHADLKDRVAFYSEKFDGLQFKRS
ncbi:MAG TPA: DUF427 domain-containing protein [Burkholderiaceae bacterium]